MAVGTAKQINGFADIFGGKNYNTVDYSGPASYAGGVAGGDKLDPKAFGSFNDIIAVIGVSLDQTGLFYVLPQPLNNGVTQWFLRWFTVTAGGGIGGEVANGVNLSGKTVKVSIIGS
jgi:hypothetical protein